MSNNHFIWDSYSDQPQVIKDRAFKKATRRKELKDNLKLLFTSIFILPISIIFMKFFKGNVKSSNIDFIGLGVNLDKDDGKNTQQDLVQELGVKNLIIRLPLSDIKNIDLYFEFANSFNKNERKNILINVIQDRLNIENQELFKKNIDLIFQKFENISNEFQIGTTINRLKWGFFSTEEFMNFYIVASKIKEDRYPNIKLLGPSVIDFEYYYNARSMFNLKKIKYDITSALLYVDRRGAPQNSQYGIFDLKNKIELCLSNFKLNYRILSRLPIMTFLLGFGMLFIVVYTNVKNIIFPELVQISIMSIWTCGIWITISLSSIRNIKRNLFPCTEFCIEQNILIEEKN